MGQECFQSQHKPTLSNCFNLVLQSSSIGAQLTLLTGVPQIKGILAFEVSIGEDSRSL